MGDSTGAEEAMTGPANRTVLVTGATGQLGIHTCLHLRHRHGCTVLKADRSTFADRAALAAMIGEADAILHLAGVNRGSEAEVSQGNPTLAEALIEAASASGRLPPLVYASTIHAGRDTPYGQSKRKAGDFLQRRWAAAGKPYHEAILPNLFGEFSRPNYNNFTGTFCHQIAVGQTPGVTSDAEVELLHYGDAAEAMITALDNRSSGSFRPEGQRTTVRDVADRLAGFHDLYRKGEIPALPTRFDVLLFNALRQVMFEHQFPAPLHRHADARGAFFECMRAHGAGQISFSTTLPGITRGNHFHFELVERFLVVSGRARISVRRLSDDQAWHFDVSGETPHYVDMPPLHTHNITNTGDGELLTLFWANRHFDPASPDTYLEPV